MFPNRVTIWAAEVLPRFSSERDDGAGEAIGPNAWLAHVAVLVTKENIWEYLRRKSRAGKC